MRHWAMPEAEAYHLIVTMHHGHMQGANKCAGDRALCPWGLLAGQRIEESTLREHHECEAARAICRLRYIFPVGQGMISNT